MKKLLLIFVALFTVSTITWASFPITKSSDNIEIVNLDDPTSASLLNSTWEFYERSFWQGVVSLACAIVAAFIIAPTWGPTLTFSALAIVFGIMGIVRKNGKKIRKLIGLAISGLILGALIFFSTLMSLEEDCVICS